ncbi:MAG: hypothetical protein ACUVQX_07045 [Candidatus Bathycorpusculaceae bacterium]
MFVVAFDGTRVVLKEELWRHPELKDKQAIQEPLTIQVLEERQGGIRYSEG